MTLHEKLSFRDKILMIVAPHADDDAIGCGALLFYLMRLCDEHRPKSVFIAYAVSGFNGVTDRFLRTSFGIDPAQVSVEELRQNKATIRRNEARAFCASLGATPVFWDLPFYEKRQRSFDAIDVAIAEQSFREINPDIIVLIDESIDPHGTHGLVQHASMAALKKIDFSGAQGHAFDLLGYRVWDEGYADCQCDVALFFDKELMAAKAKLISFYRSQIIDPAFPHEHYNFIDMVKHSNAKQAQRCDSELPYVECYKFLK